MEVFACCGGTRDTHSELKQEAIACVCEHWVEFAGYVTGMIGPWYVEEASVHRNIGHWEPGYEET